MEKTTAYTATGSASSGMSLGRTLAATAALLATFVVLYLGFIFLREQSNDVPRLVIAIVAIIWGVGGVALLYFVANMFVESLSSTWTSRLQPYIFVGPAIVLLAWYLAVPTCPYIC